MKKLKCPHCGDELHLELGFDGCDWESEAGEGSGYNYQLYLACNRYGCGNVFPIVRLKYGVELVSEPVEKMRAYAGRLNDT